jgi:hypothetical protein
MYCIWYHSIDLKLLPYGSMFTYFLNFGFLSKFSIFASQRNYCSLHCGNAAVPSWNPASHSPEQGQEILYDCVL